MDQKRNHIVPCLNGLQIIWEVCVVYSDGSPAEQLLNRISKSVKIEVDILFQGLIRLCLAPVRTKATFLDSQAHRNRVENVQVLQQIAIIPLPQILIGDVGSCYCLADLSLREAKILLKRSRGHHRDLKKIGSCHPKAKSFHGENPCYICSDDYCRGKRRLKQLAKELNIFILQVQIALIFPIQRIPFVNDKVERNFRLREYGIQDIHKAAVLVPHIRICLKEFSSERLAHKKNDIVFSCRTIFVFLLIENLPSGQITAEVRHTEVDHIVLVNML